MDRRWWHRLAGLMTAFLILLGFAVADNSQSFEGTIIEGDKRLEVTFLDVGQGDAILIETPNDQTILIDGGPDNTLLAALGEALPFYQRTIDLMVLSHPHADHVTGLVEVLRRYDVRQVYASGVVHTASDYVYWLQEIQEQNINFKKIDHPVTVDLGSGAVLEFLAPLRSYAGEEVAELNNTSVVNRLVYGDVAVLLTGDAEAEQEEALLRSEQDLRAEVLKVGHHGSDSSTTKDFLAAVSPRWAVISSGVDNSFGHPHKEVLRRLQRADVEVFRTDMDGTITMVSDGKNVFWQIDQ